jgi:hypothetical protein
MNENQEQEVPMFDEAIKQFQEFIARQQIVTDLLWVFREDLSSYKQRILIKQPLPEANLTMVKSLYECGRQQGLGVRLDMLCLLDAKPCCYVWVPKDIDEAGRHLLLLSKFIMSIPEKLLSARSIGNPLSWAWYKWYDRKRGWNKLAERV